MSKTWWHRNEVKERYRISEATLYRMIRQGSFPKPTKITPGRNSWHAAALDEYDQKLIAESEEASDGS